MTAGYAALAAIVVLVVAVVVSYNRFVAQRHAIDAAWGTVDVELQRRHDLIPNLVEVVQGYAAHERDVLDRVVSLRAQAVAADGDPGVGPAGQARVEDDLGHAVHVVLAVAAAYPDLKASRGFLDLQAQLVETEDRIAAARRLYNIGVMHYNRRVEAVPSNVVAAIAGFARRELFEASALRAGR